MKGLMVFDYEKNSHDILSEQNIRKATLQEQDSPIEDCVTISHIGRFGISNITGSGAFKDFKEKISETIASNPKLAEKITRGVVYVTEFSLIGGASNHYEKHSVTPEKNNDRKSDYSGQPYQKDSKSSHFKKNKKLAIDRAKGLADALNADTEFREQVSFDAGVLEHAKDHAEGFVIDTGGINDKPNENSWTINGITYAPRSSGRN